MSAPTELSIAMAASASRTTIAASDVAGERDLYSLWKAVFERAGASAASDSPVAYPQSVGQTAAGGVHVNTSGSRESACSSEPVIDLRSGADSAATQSIAARAPAAAVARLVASSAGAMPSNVLSGGAVFTRQVPALATPPHSPDVFETAQVLQQVWLRAAAGALPTAAAESVNVFVSGAAVAVVVRNASLSDEGALRCAFETARELTGESAALEQLTLNGRTVYYRGESRRKPAALVAALLFSG